MTIYKCKSKYLQADLEEAGGRIHGHGHNRRNCGFAACGKQCSFDCKKQKEKRWR